MPENRQKWAKIFISVGGSLVKSGFPLESLRLTRGFPLKTSEFLSLRVEFHSIAPEQPDFQYGSQPKFWYDIVANSAVYPITEHFVLVIDPKSLTKPSITPLTQPITATIEPNIPRFWPRFELLWNFTTYY